MGREISKSKSRKKLVPHVKWELLESTLWRGWLFSLAKFNDKKV